MTTIKEIQKIRERAKEANIYDTLTSSGYSEWLDIVDDLCGDIIEARKDQNRLNALEWAGVDNWDGYSYAMELLEEHERKNES